MGIISKKIEIKNLNVTFGVISALKNVSLDVFSNEILSIIGPANSGKSTLLLAINKMTDRISNVNLKGNILLDGRDINTIRDVEELRRRIGMVYAFPIPLPMTIRENLLFGPRLRKRLNKAKADEIVET